MSRYTENLSLISFGFAFASLFTAIFGSIFLYPDSGPYGTLEYDIFGAGLLLFFVFLLVAITILFTDKPKEQPGSKDVMEKMEERKV
ncbi:MAG: hypothetical protein M1515_02760 [Candidatus Thermoplasmatota archaeon]|jgi:hypothetical protein|nr:hypothetical protein [Candidatus Thermoplasmatota archaeon]